MQEGWLISKGIGFLSPSFNILIFKERFFYLFKYTQNKYWSGQWLFFLGSSVKLYIITKNIIDQNVSDYWLEKGDYVNIEHITIGYNIPMKSKAVKSLRLSAGISNLATITGYSGLTPMINSYVVSNTLGIDDKRTYPLYRTYSLGLSIQF